MNVNRVLDERRSGPATREKTPRAGMLYARTRHNDKLALTLVATRLRHDTKRISWKAAAAAPTFTSRKRGLGHSDWVIVFSVA